MPTADEIAWKPRDTNSGQAEQRVVPACRGGDNSRHLEVIAIVRGPSQAFRDDRKPTALESSSDCPAGNPLQGNLARAFLSVARCRGAHPAIVTSSGRYSYAWLESAAAAVRHELLGRRSFEPGARVAMLLGNSPDYVAAFYGILLAGGVAVPLPPDIETDRLRYILEACEIRVLLSTPEVLAHRRAIFSGEAAMLLLDASNRTGMIDPSGCEKNVHALAAILFTAGSTGSPKGVMLSHGNLLCNAWSIAEYLDIGPDERALVILPFYHAFGNSVLQTHILAGATLVLDGSLTFPDSISEGLERHSATSFSGVPEVYQLLLARSSLGKRRLGSLRCMTVAGGALRASDAVEVARRIAPARFYVMYGQTEATARLSFLRPELLASRSGSIGKGIPGVELQVVDGQGRPVPPGRRGEIRARGPNVMLGYWKDPEATDRVLRNGWLYTGDWGTVDAEGFIYPQGRSNALLKVNGFRVHPSEVEDYVMGRLPLLRAVVVPYESNGLGTRLALFAQPRDGGEPLRVEQVRLVCQRGLPRHKLPEYVEVVGQLPLNDAMKIDRPALAGRAARHAALSRAYSHTNGRHGRPARGGDQASQEELRR